MILQMIGADGKHRGMLLDDSARTIQCVSSAPRYPSLCKSVPLQKSRIESDAVHYHVTLAIEEASFPSPENVSVPLWAPTAAHCSVMDSRSGRIATSFSVS